MLVQRQLLQRAAWQWFTAMETAAAAPEVEVAAAAMAAGQGGAEHLQGEGEEEEELPATLPAAHTGAQQA